LIEIKFNAQQFKANIVISNQKHYLKKLNQYNERQKDCLKDFQKKTNLKQIVVEKYTKLYPNATITVKSDWTKYSGSFEVIEVKFESGSYVQFKLDTYLSKEYLYKKHDAEFANLNSDELLERFSKQNKKGSSQLRELSYITVNKKESYERK
jgi:hypothetical protein